MSRQKTKGQLTAATLLDVITVLKQGQEIDLATLKTNAEMQALLVELRDGQGRIEAELQNVTKRTNSHQHQLSDHETRLQKLEKNPLRPVRTG